MCRCFDSRVISVERGMEQLEHEVLSIRAIAVECLLLNAAAPPDHIEELLATGECAGVAVCSCIDSHAIPVERGRGTFHWVGYAILEGLLGVAHKGAREEPRVDALLLPHVHAVGHAHAQAASPAVTAVSQLTDGLTYVGRQRLIGEGIATSLRLAANALKQPEAIQMVV